MKYYYCAISHREIFHSIPVFEACCEVSQYLDSLREVEVRKYSNSPCVLRPAGFDRWLKSQDRAVRPLARATPGPPAAAKRTCGTATRATSAPREPAGRGPSATGPQVRPLPSHGPLCAEPSRRERALLQIPLLRAQHVLRASGFWESASFHCCSQKTITPSPLVIAWFHFSETDALLAVCGLRCIVGGASMLRPPQPLSSHATCWPAAALWRAHLHASPSSCGMAGSAAHRTCERLAIDHLTLLHRATHTLVAHSGVGTAPWTRGTRTRRENPCQASFSRPTGAQSAPLAPPVPPASDGTLRPLRVLLGSRQQRLVAWAGRPFETAREAAEEALFRR